MGTVLAGAALGMGRTVAGAAGTGGTTGRDTPAPSEGGQTPTEKGA